MVKKIIKILVIVFLIAPYTLIGLLTLLISILSLDLYGIAVSLFMLSVPYPLFRSAIKKRSKSKHKQAVELPQLQTIDSPQSSTIFCTRCGAAMEESCKYCKDCGALLNKTQEVTKC